MIVRWTKVVLLLVALVGCLYAAAGYSPARWRAGLLYQKLGGELRGVTWQELAARLAPEALGIQAMLGPGPDHFIQKLDYPIHLNEDWKMYPAVLGGSGCLNELDVHFSVLKAGKIPHELHEHREEEVLIPLFSETEILRADQVNSTDPEVERIGPGQFVYHPSGQAHTIRGVEPGPSTYLVVRWRDEAKPPAGDVMPASIFDYQTPQEANARGAGFATTLLFESPTAHLDKLHSHASTLHPGAGYDAHGDPYDVVILLLEGTVETIGQQVSAPSVIVYSAYKPHGMRNPGDTPAKYLVFEFHGCGPV
jgi:mannose-6-phosphate isomerase-like protein (cupin superfamily)